MDVSTILENSKKGLGVSFDDIKQHLQVQEVSWLGIQELNELTGCGYLATIETAYKALLARLKMYTVWEGFCTDTTVGEYFYTFDDKLCFATYQPYRKSDEDFFVLNEELFKEFKELYIAAHVKEEPVENLSIVSKFDFSSTLLYSFDFAANSVKPCMFLDADGYIREILTYDSFAYGKIAVVYLVGQQERLSKCDEHSRILSSCLNYEAMLATFKDKHYTDFVKEIPSQYSVTGLKTS